MKVVCMYLLKKVFGSINSHLFVPFIPTMVRRNKSLNNMDKCCQTYPPESKKAVSFGCCRTQSLPAFRCIGLFIISRFSLSGTIRHFQKELWQQHVAVFRLHVHYFSIPKCVEALRVFLCLLLRSDVSSSSGKMFFPQPFLSLI